MQTTTNVNLCFYRLEYLYLGGNKLRHVPRELGNLPRLSFLALGANHLQSLPRQLNRLSALRSLHLHDNQLQTLPRDVLQLSNLQELSLRNNPLVMRFVKEWPDTVPTLLELSGRAVKRHSIPYSHEVIPATLVEFLNSGRQCDNPTCTGVYFTSNIKRVKFLDFCGKYRVPLMHYLCSPLCDCEEGVASYYTSSSEDEADEAAAQSKMKKVLLG